MNTWTSDDLAREYEFLRTKAAAQFLQHGVLVPVAFVYATRPKAVRVCLNLIEIWKDGGDMAEVARTAARECAAAATVIILEAWMVIQRGGAVATTPEEVRSHRDKQEVLSMGIESPRYSATWFAPVRRTPKGVRLEAWRLLGEATEAPAAAASN
jgi:hypothetical protein